MKEVSITRKDASLLYLEMERGNHLKDLSVANIASIGRLADGFEDVLGEYPASKGPTQQYRDPMTQEMKEAETWKLDYPSSTYVPMRVEADDYELLLKLWDKMPKERMASTRDGRKQCERIEAALRPGGKVAPDWEGSPKKAKR